MSSKDSFLCLIENYNYKIATHTSKAWKRNCQRINLIFFLSSFLKDVIWGGSKDPPDKVHKHCTYVTYLETDQPEKFELQFAFI